MRRTVMVVAVVLVTGCVNEVGYNSAEDAGDDAAADMAMQAVDIGAADAIAADMTTAADLYAPPDLPPDLPPTCGAEGQGCCAGGSACQMGLTCSGTQDGGFSCKSCGATGQACCAGDQCVTGYCGQESYPDGGFVPGSPKLCR